MSLYRKKTISGKKTTANNTPPMQVFFKKFLNQYEKNGIWLKQQLSPLTNLTQRQVNDDL